MGLKENVIMGHLIPCGTGARHLRGVTVIDSDAEADAAGAERRSIVPTKHEQR